MSFPSLLPRLRMRGRQALVLLPAMYWACTEWLALWRARRRPSLLRPR